MKVLFKSFYLYFLGILADAHKSAFDKAVERSILCGGDISSRKLIQMSDRSYRLCMKFENLENEIKNSLQIKALVV